jgi:lysophospholipase L1-like esterase
VLGDSTAFGVGACEPDHSVAGRIAAAFPDARVFNYSKSGARARHVHGQLDAYPYPTADVVLVQVGANDVLGVHPVARIEVDLRAAFERARALGAVVFFMPGNNFSFAPFFVWPAQGLLCWRALRIHAMVQRLVEETGVFYVNLLADPAEDPFMLEPRRYYSADGLHPSSEGYGFYYTALLAQGRLGEYLGASALGVPSLAPA